ncbi:RNA-binding protein 33 isoform X1 [Momordica charantia]|uniref:RNA-binding protein 33 isoform X1 n=1 Tax=Momordica charantia TaxID=3673 RepID=A0A6J1C742_MOMCH|nr:RNA-binding protein 33 isoform X1 [Momordica charantia]
MAGKQVAGTGLPESIAGMSKNQLYDIMSQMKTLIEQNQQQAKQILIQNPLLTKALFQAQIMLGMVRPPQIPSIQPSTSHHSQPSTHTTHQSNIQPTQTPAGQISLQEQTNAPPLAPPRKQYQNQPSMPISSTTLPTVNVQPQSAPLIPLQTPQHPKGFEMHQANPISVPQPSQVPSVPPVLPSAAQPPLLHQPQISTASVQLQQPLQTAEIPHLPLQAPLPPQSRAPTGPNFHQHYPQQVGHNMNYQPAGIPQHVSQPMFHSGTKLPPGIGNSFPPQGQSAVPSQPPPQSMYQAGGSKLGTEFMNQVGTSKPADRGPWMPGPPENPTLPQQLSGPPPSVPGQMGPGNQPRPAPPLSQEMEKMLLQQVMSLTPEQINLLPPEQRNQVFQLQKILRQ